MSKPTPGEWIAKKLATYQDPGWVVQWPDKGGTHMRRLDYQGHFTEADAKLIAASKNMLAALQGAQGALRKALPHLPADAEAVHVGEWLDEIAAVIAKATPEDLGIQPCEFCGHPFNVLQLGRRGCPNCEGSGIK